MHSGYHQSEPSKHFLENMKRDWNNDKTPFPSPFFSSADELSKKRNEQDQPFIPNDRKDGKNDLNLPSNIIDNKKKF